MISLIQILQKNEDKFCQRESEYIGWAKLICDIDMFFKVNLTSLIVTLV